MKDLKKKLTAATAMLVVSAVMLSGVSYAWYTLSTNPEVSNIKANIAANENLEIALDNGYTNEDAVNDASKVANAENNNIQGSQTGNPYTWGNLIDLKTAMDTLNSTTGKNLLLSPVKYNNGNLEYPKYGTDGRVASVEAYGTPTNISDHSSTDVAGELEGGVKAFSKDESTYDAISIDFWIRANEKTEVTLSADPAKRAGSINDKQTGTTDVNTVEGKGSYISLPIPANSENKVANIDKYVSNLVVRFDVTTFGESNSTTSYYAKLTKDASSKDATETAEGVAKYSLALDSVKNSANGNGDAKISLEANIAKKVTMYIYIDGETIANKDALLDDLTGMEMNIQFQSNTTTTPGAMNGATN